MQQKFIIEIISPEKNIYTGEVEEAVLPCYEGMVTILKDHIPLITFLRPGIIEISSNEKFYVEEGTVEFFDNKLLVLSTSVKNLKNLKTEKIKDMINETESKILNNEINDKQRYILNHKIDTLKQIS